jgi:predicted RNase H-like nuclease
MISMNDGRYIGVDGCRGGWIACILNHGEFLLERFDSLEALADHYFT